LIAPLAKVPRNTSLAPGVGEVLARLTASDARDVYEAIRIAEPGGMGKVDSADVAGPPPDDLLAAMRLAADRDLVARQYAENFCRLTAKNATSNINNNRSVIAHLRGFSRIDLYSGC
jgi:triphosphoribosyl-dephospho-CoA synthase